MSESARPKAREGLMLDRRAFLGSVGVAAGAVIAGAMLPLSVASTAELDVGTAAADGLWSVDVICGHWPPYSHPIPYGRAEAVDATLASMDYSPSLDQMLVA